MRLLKILSVAAVAASVGIASAAHADIITATWTATVSSGSDAGDSAVLSFTFDTSDLGSATNAGTYIYYATAPSFFSSATIALNGGAAQEIVTGNDASQSQLSLGGAGEIWKNGYADFVEDTQTGDFARIYFDDLVGGITTTDPSEMFTVNNFSNEDTEAVFSVAGNLNFLNLHTLSVSAASADGVPAPGGLALLGLGLAGFGAMRRAKYGRAL